MLKVEELVESFLKRWTSLVSVERGFTEAVKKNGRDVYLKITLKKTVEAKTGKDVKDTADKLSRLAHQIIEEEKIKLLEE